MPILRYGHSFNCKTDLEVELAAFRLRLTPKDGGLGRARHFENLVRALWPEFVWLEDGYRQADAVCNHDVSGFTSGASYMKSDILAKYALLCWGSDPLNTLVIVCSTGVGDAKMRIWGHIVRDFRRIRASNHAVGKLIESQSIIKLSEADDGVASSDNSSICLVAAGNEFKDDALRRLQGRKNKKVILIVDEMQDISDTVIDEALWNLCANDHFEVHVAGNAASRHDPHGKFMKPVEGWQAVNKTTGQWKIKVGLREGVALHFDATRPDSPNMKRYREGQPQLTFMRKAEEIMGAKEHLGEDNPQYLRQYVGFWPEKDQENNYIVTEAALTAHNAYDTLGEFSWASSPVGILGMDPSYSTDGDRFMLMHAMWGLCTDQLWRLYFSEAIHLTPKPIPGETRDFAAIRMAKAIAERLNISPRYVGMDASAGTPLLSIAHQMWSSEILAVPFGGSPTDLPVSTFDKRLSKELYANRTSELAYSFVEFLKSDQIRGVRPDHAKELVARQYQQVAGNKIKIEKKADLKKRLGFSPDIADSSAVCIAVLRDRLRALPGRGTAQAGNSNGDWKALMQKRDVVSRTEGHGVRQGFDVEKMLLAGLRRR